MCVRRNAQHGELNLPKSTRFVLITAGVLLVVSSNGPTVCLVSHFSLSSQNVQSHEKSPTSHRVRGETKAMILALAANRESKERVKGKASRIKSIQIGSVLVCVRRNAQHLELKLPDSMQFVLITDVMGAMSTCGPTGCPVRVILLSRPERYSHTKNPPQAIGAEVKQRP